METISYPLGEHLSSKSSQVYIWKQNLSVSVKTVSPMIKITFFQHIFRKIRNMGENVKMFVGGTPNCYESPVILRFLIRSKTQVQNCKTHCPLPPVAKQKTILWPEPPWLSWTSLQSHICVQTYHKDFFVKNRFFNKIIKSITEDLNGDGGVKNMKYGPKYENHIAAVWSGLRLLS